MRFLKYPSVSLTRLRFQQQSEVASQCTVQTKTTQCCYHWKPHRRNSVEDCLKKMLCFVQRFSKSSPHRNSKCCNPLATEQRPPVRKKMVCTLTALGLSKIALQIFATLQISLHYTVKLFVTLQNMFAFYGLMICKCADVFVGLQINKCISAKRFV